MIEAISSRSISRNAQLVGAGESFATAGVTRSRMTDSRLIGALFLSGFLCYGIGAGLVTSVTGAPDFLSTISAHQTTLVLGAFLMLLNTVVDVGKAVLFSRSWSSTASEPRSPIWPR